jgi:hypothetical protein
LALVLGALFHLPDLTLRLVCLAETCRHRHHHHLPESTSATSTSPREQQALHASRLDPDPLLRTSATKPVAADCQSTLSELPLAKP